MSIIPVTQGHLTQIFPTFPNPIVNLDFHTKTDLGQIMQMVGNSRFTYRLTPWGRLRIEMEKF